MDVVRAVSTVGRGAARSPGHRAAGLLADGLRVQAGSSAGPRVVAGQPAEYSLPTCLGRSHRREIFRGCA